MKTWLTFKDIEYVQAIAKAESVTRAANELHLSQPALSIYIKNLEDRLGVRLFERIGKRMILTYAGQCMTNGGTEILNMLNSLTNKMDEIVSEGKGVISVGMPPNSGASVAPLFIKEFRASHPNVEVILTEGTPSHLIEALCNGEFDLAITPQAQDDKRLVCEYLFSDTIVLYVSNSSPLIAKAVPREGFPYPWIDLSLCKDMEFVTFHQYQNAFALFRKICGDFGFVPRVSVQVQNPVAAMSMVAENCGVHLNTSFDKQKFSFPAECGITRLSVGKEAPYRVDMYVARRSELFPSQIVTDFVASAKKALENSRKSS